MGKLVITSPANRVVKETTALKSRKYRDERELFVIEGERFVSEIPPDWSVRSIMLSENFALSTDIAVYEEQAETMIVSDELFKRMSDTVTPGGVLAVCGKKKYCLEDVIKKEYPFLLLGSEINDPGNLGTAIRTAHAAGVHAVVLSHGCADVYNPKTLRATAGSVFHIPVFEDADMPTVLEGLKRAGIKTLAAHVKGGHSPYTLDLSGGVAVIIGNEARGIPDDIAEGADYLVKIPMPGQAESLNASVACGILLYEVVRQRIKN